ncbi:DnaB-like helicase C-terminal domain-containing protein [bacterium]|nr:DnaB-like helicase C-terminal domain-containing protein [bacterium]
MGKNKGLPMGEGLDIINKAIGGVQKGKMYAVASPPKVGKSTFVDYGFILGPALHARKHNIKLNIMYYSFEMSRIVKQFDFMCFFLNRNHGIECISLPFGKKHKGKNYVELSSSYLRGVLQDDNGDIILVSPDVEKVFIETYHNEIVPLFGMYSPKGERLSEGVINFIEQEENPTGIWKTLMAYANVNGKFITEKWTGGEKIVGYEPYDDDIYNIVITDHLRLLKQERGFNEKQNIDKYINYTKDIRNWCDYSFVHIIHTNRTLGSSDKMKYMGDLLHPGPEDIKQTGNLSEACNYFLTLFNPNDLRYNLKTHFGLKIKDNDDNILYPNLRTAHLIESRECYYPQHFRLNMMGNLKKFETFK